MYKYKITVKFKGTIVSQGDTPMEAFAKKFPYVDLVPVSANTYGANVCIELMNGKKQSINYYIGKPKVIKQNQSVEGQGLTKYKVYEKGSANRPIIEARNPKEALYKLLTANGKCKFNGTIHEENTENAANFDIFKVYYVRECEDMSKYYLYTVHKN